MLCLTVSRWMGTPVPDMHKGVLQTWAWSIKARHPARSRATRGREPPRSCLPSQSRGTVVSGGLAHPLRPSRSPAWPLSLCLGPQAVCRRSETGLSAWQGGRAGSSCGGQWGGRRPRRSLCHPVLSPVPHPESGQGKPGCLPAICLTVCLSSITYLSSIAYLSCITICHLSSIYLSSIIYHYHRPTYLSSIYHQLSTYHLLPVHLSPSTYLSSPYHLSPIAYLSSVFCLCIYL